MKEPLSFTPRSLLLLASLSLSFAACDAGPDDDLASADTDADDDGDDDVRGNPLSEASESDDTTFRIEIGSNDTSSPQRNAVALVGGCTGTLVAPDLLITAAHCGFADEAYFTGGWTTLSSPMWVQFGPDRSNPLFTTTATQVSAPPLHTAGPDWLDDMVLLRLATSVPAATAVPRPVYLDHPAPLQPYSLLPDTIYQIGYGGGRDRRIMTGSNYVDWQMDSSVPGNGFNYDADEAAPGIGDRDTNIEGGDSGGPMLLNSDTGPVMGVLSFWHPYGIATYGTGTGGRSPIRSWLQGKLPMQKPNFEIVEITEGGCTGSGGNPQVAVTVKNSGAVTARAWVDVFTGLAAPPTIGTYSSTYRMSDYLAPEGTQTMWFEITNGFENGWVDVLVDTTQTVAELDENDNGAYDYVNLPDCSFN